MNWYIRIVLLLNDCTAATDFRSESLAWLPVKLRNYSSHDQRYRNVASLSFQDVYSAGLFFFLAPITK